MNQTEVYQAIAAAALPAVQRELAARGLTRGALLPATVMAGCISGGISDFNRAGLFSDRRPATFEDTATHRQRVLAYLIGYGPIDPYIRLSNLEEVAIKGHARIWARFGHSDDPDAPPPGKRLLPIHFASDQEIVDLLRPRLAEVGAVWDTAHRIGDCTLADGIRFHGVLPAPGQNRPVIVHLRRHPTRARFLSDLIGEDTLTPGMATYLTSAVLAKLNILIVGAPNAGKSTTMNALIMVVNDPEENIVLIESAPELVVANEAYHDVVPDITAHLTSGATPDSPHAVTERDLARAALRESATRVALGEVRGAEAFDWLQCLNLGTNGSWCTIHGNSCEEGLIKLHDYALWAGLPIPSPQLVRMISNTVNVVLFQECDPRTFQRRISEIVEVTGYAGGITPTLQPLFHWDRDRQAFGWSGHRPYYAEQLLRYGLPLGVPLPGEAGRPAAD